MSFEHSTNLDAYNQIVLQNSFSRPIKQRFPLLSWNYFIESFHNNIIKLKKDNDFEYLKNLSLKYKWKNDLQKLFAENQYEALILTDAMQKIVWVNQGFSDMTGYTKKYALNKNPKFLQGAATSIDENSKIKLKLSNNKIFSGIIINYKKDNTLYKCKVKIIPLYNKDTTHYLAFESEVI